MNGGAAVAEQEIAERRLRRAEGDAFHAAAVLPLERHLHVVGPDLAAIPQPMLREGKERLRMAGAIWARLVEKIDEVERRPGGGQRAIDLQRLDGDEIANGSFGALFEELPKLAELTALDRQPGSHCVPTAFDQQAVVDGRTDEPPHVETVDRTQLQRPAGGISP